MELEGIHHVTAITGNAPRNVDFYVRVLGLRLVKKTVNQDDPTVYHLFYADEHGSPGSDITFFEYPGAGRGRAGAGMVHTVAFRVGVETHSTSGSGGSQTRVSRRAAPTAASRSRTRKGMRLELRAVATSDPPLVAEHPEIAPELALQGFDGVRAFASDAGAEPRSPRGDARLRAHRGRAAWEVRGESRGGFFAYDPPPAERGIGGAGTVHHVAFATQTAEQEAWQRAVAHAGMHPTPVIDRFWFRSVYFREPNGVLFELATLGPGFAVDEDPEHLGEASDPAARLRASARPDRAGADADREPAHGVDQDSPQ